MTFAYSLPPGHFFQAKLEGIEETAGFDLLVPEANIQKAVQEFSHPDVESPQKATAGGAEREAEAVRRQGAAAARDDDHRPERERRHRLGRNGELPALAAQLPDGLPAGRQERERAELGVLQDADPLRQGPARRGGGGEEGRRRSSAPTTSSPLDADGHGALERGAADRDRRPDLPRHARRGAGRQDAAAAAARTSLPGAEASLALLRERAAEGARSS